MQIFKYIRDTPLECSYMPNRKFGGWPIGEAIQATASHINSAINFFANRETNKANDRINQKQIEYAREAFEKEKDYNNFLLNNQRQMQMADSKAAGVNPAFVNGSQLGGVSNPAKMDVPAQIPMNYNADYSGISSGVQSALNFFLQKKLINAQAQNLEVDSYKKLAETDRQLIENQWLPKLKEAEWNLATSTIAVNGSITFKNDEERKLFSQQVLESSKRMEKIDADIQQVQAEIENIGVNTRIRMIEMYWKSSECQANIENLRASAHLSRQQAQDIVATQAARIALLDAQGASELYKALNIQQDTENLRETHRLLGIEGDQMTFNLNSDKKYKNKERAAGLIQSATQSADNVTSAIGNLMPWKLGKGMPVKTSSYNPSNYYKGSNGQRVYYSQ